MDKLRQIDKKYLIAAAVAIIAIVAIVIIVANNNNRGAANQPGGTVATEAPANGGQTQSEDNKDGGKENTQPEITGVADLSSPAGTEIDLLANVKATDAEDGDLTAKIVIDSTPPITVTDGKATVEEPGDYELAFTVTDNGGLAAEPAYATLTVTKKTAEAKEFMTMDFSAAYTPDPRGWVATVSEPAVATAEQKQGAWVIEVTNPGDKDGQILLCKPGVALKGGADYRVKVWAKSTEDTFAHLLIKDAGTEEWKLLGEAWNLKITKAIAPLEVNFSVAEDATADVRLHLGKITLNEETTPENFTVTVDKVEFYEITGEEH